jgi:hypothetical protein
MFIQIWILTRHPWVNGTKNWGRPKIIKYGITLDTYSLTHPCNVLRMMAIGTRTKQNAAVLAEILRLTCCAPVEKRVPCVRTYVHLENIHGPNTSQSNNNWTVFFTACFPADKWEALTSRMVNQTDQNLSAFLGTVFRRAQLASFEWLREHQKVDRWARKLRNPIYFTCLT